LDTAIISKLKLKLAEPLPGRTAQLRMAPTFRPDIYKTEHSLKAGVLILLFPKPVELYTVFMKRPKYEGVHSDQISFPGGKFEKFDQSLTDTAIRETNEEIGVPAKNIQVIGTLSPLFIPVSEIEVFPTVGFCSLKPVFKIDPSEVDYLIEESLDNLLNPEIKRIKPYSGEKFTGQIPYYDVKGNHVWGATAMILSEFLEIIHSVL